jgi:hypothetical protein
MDNKITSNLAAQCQARTSRMLQQLLPGDAPVELAAAVTAGMLAGIFEELWDRSTVADFQERKATLGEMAKALALEYCDQFISAEPVRN